MRRGPEEQSNLLLPLYLPFHIYYLPLTPITPFPDINLPYYYPSLSLLSTLTCEDVEIIRDDDEEEGTVVVFGTMPLFPVLLLAPALVLTSTPGPIPDPSPGPCCTPAVATTELPPVTSVTPLLELPSIPPPNLSITPPPPVVSGEEEEIELPRPAIPAWVVLAPAPVLRPVLSWEASKRAEFPPEAEGLTFPPVDELVFPILNPCGEGIVEV